MQSEVPSQSFVWGVLAARFQSELTFQKSEIWRLSGLLEEYGGAADDDFYREREQKALIDELTGLLVQAVTHEATHRLFANNSGRRAGSPPRRYDPLFGSGTAFGVPALPRLGRPTVGCHLNRWQAQTEGSGKIVRVHQRGNPTVEPIFNDRTASEAALCRAVGSLCTC